MTEEMATDAWARTNKACFEVTPLVEMRGLVRVQVGFIIDFYARFPADKAQGEPHREGALEVWTRLRRILEAVAVDGAKTGMEVEPMRAASIMRKETDLQPEVNLRALMFHSGDYLASVTSDERARLHAFEERLQALGLKPGRW